QADMDSLVEGLGDQIPSAFATKDCEEEQEKIALKFQEQRQDLFKELEKVTALTDSTLLQTPHGIVLAPIVNGNALSPEQFNQLSEEEKVKIEKRQGELQEDLRGMMR